ncbi:unnamed protein product [Heligmosomoides polygyrus]|uniref:Protein kinase domain-containing protein n=1 Tax=Heligmosomoides polygyrus TaxID=6339 RepID=A0A183F8W6_HELPZ|nr:unnamed protein product [Heligmosomoides polygyrus]
MMRTTSSKQKRVLYAPRAIKSSSSDNCNLPVMEKDNILELPHTAALNIIMHKQYPGASSATGALLDSFAHPGVSVGEPVQEDRERIVQIFVRQLLFALKHMHDMRIAHLDLRPETILLQDDKLKLADFGQSRQTS